nr:short-chain dehydrogenase [uncultured Clostridium sp.]
MAKQEIGYRANIGTPTLILIFMILCLVTFGMLSLTTAKSEWNLAQRNADSVTEYYRADKEGEAFYQMVFKAVDDAQKEEGDLQAFQKTLSMELGDYYDSETGTISTQIPMKRSQSLSIKLSSMPDKAGKIGISQWKVIQTEDYEIDQSLPVWKGGN